MFLTVFTFYILQPDFWKHIKQLYISHHPTSSARKWISLFYSFSFLKIKIVREDIGNSSCNKNFKIAYTEKKLNI